MCFYATVWSVDDAQTFLCLIQRELDRTSQNEKVLPSCWLLTGTEGLPCHYGPQRQEWTQAGGREGGLHSALLERMAEDGKWFCASKHH